MPKLTSNEIGKSFMEESGDWNKQDIVISYSDIQVKLGEQCYEKSLQWDDPLKMVNDFQSLLISLHTRDIVREITLSRMSANRRLVDDFPRIMDKFFHGTHTSLLKAMN